MTRPHILGILNVTPDSFSDGGLWTDVGSAVAHAEALRADGAAIIDVGGESTRPGAGRVSAEDEQSRVLPVVRELVSRGIRVSIDTMNARTAAAAVEAGAEFVNDVSGGLADPEMYRVVAATGATYIAMHWREHSTTMQDAPSYGNVVAEVRYELSTRLAEAIVWGIDPAKLIVDPGLGFSKTADHNWQLLAGLPALIDLGFPVLIGASRKAFLAEFAPANAPAHKRDKATATVSVLSAQAGAWGVRVHNVSKTRRELDVWDRWSTAGGMSL
jgi:dihydropteroate synthase